MTSKDLDISIPTAYTGGDWWVRASAAPPRNGVGRPIPFSYAGLASSAWIAPRERGNGFLIPYARSKCRIAVASVS